MRPGIFARTFARPGLGEVLDAVAAHGLTEVQFNLACCGLETLPAELPSRVVAEVRSAFASRGLVMSALSATFNLIHPDPGQRSIGLDRLGVLAAAAQDLGTAVLTLCTGSRDPGNMWRAHPDNCSAAAWDDLLRSMETALGHAVRHGVVLGVEPEVSNVIDSAAKARRLLDHFRSPHLRIIMDPANLFHAGELPAMTRILEEAFALLGGDIVLAHAKDLSRDGEAGHDAAGTGVLDYPLYVSLLRRAEYDGPLILHGLREDQVEAAVQFVRRVAG